MNGVSEVLQSLRLEGGLFLTAEFTAPWCIWSRFSLPAFNERLAGKGHVMFFHFILEGGCKLRLSDDAKVLDVAAGDLVFFPSDERHLMGSHLHHAPIESIDLPPEPQVDGSDIIRFRHGGGGAITRIICGFIACQPDVWRSLRTALPRVVHIPSDQDAQGAPLADLFRLGVRESAGSRPGADAVLARLSELVVVDALRRYIESRPPEDKGLLAALRDRQVGRALALLHTDPQRAWTVDDLAREVALSRSALAGRFASIMGESPIRYLARQRLAAAAQTLRNGKIASIERLAEKSGYESAAAFTRAFKREFGMPPAAWRRASERNQPAAPVGRELAAINSGASG